MRTGWMDSPMFRWLILAVLLSALTVSGYHRARARLGGETVARRREGSLLLTLRGLMALALFGGILAHVLRPDWMGWATFEVPWTLRWIGLVLGVLTVPSVHWVLLLALGLMAGSWLVLLATAVAFVMLRVLVIPREAQALQTKFGARYCAYMQTTGRLVPRVQHLRTRSFQ